MTAESGLSARSREIREKYRDPLNELLPKMFVYEIRVDSRGLHRVL